MIAEEAYVLSKSFTKKSLDGQGALKGAPCTIKNITEVEGGQKVTFEWTGTSGTKQTSEMTVKNGVSVIGISDKGNGVFTLLFSDGSESDPIQCVKGEDGFSPTATVEKVGKVATITITDKNGTTTATIKDGEGSEGGEANAIDSISVNGVNVVPDENKNVDITVPSIEGLTKDADLATVAKSGNYEDLSNKPAIPSVEGLAKTTDIPTKVSQLENDFNYLSSIPEEYVTETELEAKGYLTEHQDISGKVDKVEGKSLISDTEIARLATVDNYDDTDIKAEIAKKADTTSIPRKVSVLENDSKYQTESDVTTTLSDYATKTYVGEQITNAEHLKREIVTVLPSDTEASDNIIYMLKVESTTGNDKYQEYMKIDGTVQMVGDTSVDLTDYAKTVDIPTTVAELTDSADYAKTADVNDSISTLQTDKANASDLTAHTDDADIHVTADNKTLWNTVEDKVDKTSIATALDDTVTDEQVASALLAKTELDKKIDKTSIATELSDASTDDEVVGALTAYNELQKLESANKEQFATASGDFITVNDSVDGNIVELGVKGNSFQKTYSGKNLITFPYYDTTKTVNGITFTVNSSDGSVTANGTATSNAIFFFRYREDNPLTAGNYVLSGTPKGGSKTTYYQWFGIWDGTTNIYGVYDVGDSANITLTDELCSQYLVIGCYVYSGATVSNLTFYPQLELGDTATEFEPYVGGIPAPNPSYPQTINSVGDDGSLVVTSCGKNLAKNANLSTSLTSREVTFVTKSDGTIVVNGTPTQATDNWVWCTGNSNFLLRKGKYLWTGCPTNDGSNKYRLLLRNVEKPWKENNDYGNGVTFELTEDKAFCFFVGISYGYVANNLTFKPMLRRCDDNWIPYGDDLYEPYHETTTTIPLSEPLRSIGDIKDEITYQDGKWGVLRRIKEINLTDLAWELVNNGTYQYWRYSVNDGKEASSYNTIANIIAEKYMASSWYNTVQLNSATNAIAYGFNANNTSSKLIAVHNGSTTESPTGKFLYELVTPTFEPFADQTLPYLSTYGGVTNISNDDALSAEMTVKYPTTDASGVGSRNESRIAELAKDTDDKFDDVNESLSVIGKCKNLLNPTLQTTTQNGVTCTNNGDGTYTLNGTASSDVVFELESYKSYTGKEKFRLVGCPNGGGKDKYYLAFRPNNAEENRKDIGSGVTFNDLSTSNKYAVAIIVLNGTTVTNLTFKPMLTENLNATYDDFVPYTGDGDTLTHDVAEIKNDLVPKKIELQNVDERVTIQDNGSFIINGFAFVNLLVTFNETLPQWSNFVRLPRPKGGNVSVHCENSVKLTIYSQDNLPGDCGTYDIVQSGTEIRLLVNYEIA